MKRFLGLIMVVGLLVGMAAVAYAGKCPNCNGSGVKKCLDCSGRGTKWSDCGFCGGSGQRDTTLGVKVCDYCKGQGHQPCNSCSGSGMSPCNSCRGTGQTN